MDFLSSVTYWRRSLKIIKTANMDCFLALHHIEAIVEQWHIATCHLKIIRDKNVGCFLAIHFGKERLYVCFETRYESVLFH